MSINTTIIQAGERPLFHAKQLVQNIYRDIARSSNPYDNTGAVYIYFQIAQLYVFAENIQILEDEGRRAEVKNLGEYLFSLPLFFTTEQTHKWETEKPWSTYTYYSQYIHEYGQSFESLTPSEAYQAKTDAQKAIWLGWLEKAPMEEIRQVLEQSAQRLFKWEQERTEPGYFFKNITLFAQLIGFNEVDAKRWYFCQALSLHSSKIFNNYLQETRKNDEGPFASLLGICENAFELPRNSLCSIFSPDSPFVALNLVNNFSVLDNKLEYHENWKKLNNLVLTAKLDTELLNHYSLLSLFAQPYHTALPYLAGRASMSSQNILTEAQHQENVDVNMAFFAHVKNLDLISKALEFRQPLKILVYGEPGMGKSTLIATLLAKAKYTGWSPLKENAEATGNKDKKLSQLQLAQNLIQHLPYTALVVDHAEERYDLLTTSHMTDLFGHTNKPQIWIVSSLSKIHPQLAQSFDMVVALDHMPIDTRIKIAESFFPDYNTAVRVAQTVKSPKELVQVKNWCVATQDFSWKNISSLLRSFAKIHSASQTSSLSLQPVDTQQDFPPIAGNQVLDELTEKLVNIYENRNSYKLLGAEPPKGVLLLGPPGTGKTHFVRNLSKKIDIPMFAPETSKLAENPDLIKTMFEELKRHTPCILFLDETDALITNPVGAFGVDLARQKIANAFLMEVDGLHSNEGILIIGATHRYKNIDPAATRSGRLSEVVHLSMPSKASRIDIWKAHLLKKQTRNLDLESLSQASGGFSGADIAESVNKAAVSAAQDKGTAIEQRHFLRACDEVFWGHADNSHIMNQTEREMVAYHEAGHALLAWKNNLMVQRITVRPRSGSLGAVHWLPEEGTYTSSLSAIKGTIEMMLGGICAEKVKVGYYTNGGSQDLQQAQKLLSHALLKAGLGQDFYFGDMDTWSNEQRLKIEAEASDIMKEVFESAQGWLSDNLNLLEDFAQELLISREMSGSELFQWKNRVEGTQLFLTTTHSPEIAVLHQNREEE